MTQESKLALKAMVDDIQGQVNPAEDNTDKCKSQNTDLFSTFSQQENRSNHGRDNYKSQGTAEFKDSKKESKGKKSPALNTKDIKSSFSPKARIK